MCENKCKTKWVEGGHGSSRPCFISADTVAYKCGVHIKFLQVTSGECQLFVPPSDGIGVLVGEERYSVFAFSETCLNPKILVYKYPLLVKVHDLTGGAELEFASLSLCDSEYLAALSGVPDFKVSLWKWTTGDHLVSADVATELASVVKFSPLDWHSLITWGHDKVQLWEVEKCCSDYSLKASPLPQPPDGISSCCWTPTGDICISDNHGVLWKVNTEKKTLKLAWTIQKSTRTGDKHCDEHDGDEDGDLQSAVITALSLHQDGVLYCTSHGLIQVLSFSEPQPKVLAEKKMEDPLQNLVEAMDLKRHVGWTKKGSLFLCTGIESLEICPLLDLGGCPYYLAATFLLPTAELTVTVSRDRLLQVWEITGSLVASAHLEMECTQIAASPVCSCLAVGSNTGNILLFSIDTLKQPIFMYGVHLYKEPIQHLQYGPRGRIIVATAEQSDKFFVLQGYPSRKFKVINYGSINGTVSDIAIVSDDMYSRVYILASPSVKLPANKFLIFSVRGDTVLIIGSFKIPTPCLGLCLSADGEAFFTVLYHTKQLVKYLVPEEHILPTLSVLVGKWSCGHELPEVTMYRACNQLFLGGYDGCVTNRQLDKAGMFEKSYLHHSSDGGVKNFCVSPDGCYLLTVGGEGCVVCMELKSPQEAGMHELQGDLAIIGTRETEKLRELWELDQPALPSADDLTWLEMKEEEERKKLELQFKAQQKEIKTSMKSIRKQVRMLLDENAHLLEEERLDEQEFELDTEEQNQKIIEGKRSVAAVRAEIMAYNMAVSHLREKLKHLCWDSMDVKGRFLKGFKSGLAVGSYPLPPHTAEDMQELQRVTQQREMEIKLEDIEQNIRKAYTNLPGPSAYRLVPPSDAAEEEEAAEEGQGSQYCHSGSLSHRHVLPSNLLYSQLQLHTKQSMNNQIVLLKEVVHQLKVYFNKQLDNLYQQKEQVMERVLEWNSRLRYINRELGKEQEVIDPTWDLLEKPERVLEVYDHEISVEKYISPDQKKILEQKTAEDEKWRLTEAADNFRERAVKEMMGGVLEVTKEDELKKDIPQPAFMTSRPMTEWSEDERKIAKEYDKKVKELSEEREKYRKQLETEVRKLQASIQEITAGFDEKLAQLSQLRLKVESSVYHEEFKIIWMHYSLTKMDCLNRKEQQLSGQLEEARLKRQSIQNSLGELRFMVEECQLKYDSLLTKDKAMDKGFKKEFVDIPTYQVDQLYKLFRRRPTIQQKIQRMAEHPTTLSELSPPPANRISSAQQQAHIHDSLMKALLELSTDAHRPEGIDKSSWERMCSIRKMKVESEHQVRLAALQLAEAQAVAHSWGKDEAQNQNVMDTIMADITKVREEKLQIAHDIQIQLILKQGQVEMDPGEFSPNFLGSVLVHRTVVENLNSIIKRLGESKLQAMQESKDFHQGILQLEWEHKRMTMVVQDLNSKLHDIQNLRVTRQVQSFLTENNHAGKQLQEMMVLENNRSLQGKYHLKKLDQFESKLQKLQQQLEQQQQDNQHLGTKIHSFNIDVSSMQLKRDPDAEKFQEEASKERMACLVRRKQLVQKIRRQQHQLLLLGAELEQLRLKTYPTLGSKV